MTISLTEVQARLMRDDLRRFCKDAWHVIDPAPLVWGWHMDALADHLSYVSMGDIKQLIINMPPRLSKSTIHSVLWPAWDWIETPQRQFLTASYALQLATRDTLKSRRLLMSPWYQARFSRSFSMSPDENAKRQYSNDQGGRRIAAATDAATTGEGGDLIMVDDPHNALEAESPIIRQRVLDWWDGSFQNRMSQQNTGGWVVTGQRTNAEDLFQHILDTQDKNKIVHLVLPNEYNPKRKCITYLPGTKEKIFEDPRKTAGALISPKRMNAERTKTMKRTMGDKYSLQYQQDPKAGEGNILKRAMWKVWTGEPPDVEQVITVWDTAYGEKQENDYSARTDWGVFRHREVVQRTDGQTASLPERNCIILLGAWRGRVPFHVLKKRALAHYSRHRPDYTLIERKVSGISLIQEFRRLGISSVRGIKIDHGGKVKIDLVERANIISSVFEDGCVYYLDTPAAEDVISEASAFPNAPHDDYVSTITMAVQWARRRGELRLWEDDQEDGSVRLFKRKKQSIYG